MCVSIVSFSFFQSEHQQMRRMTQTQTKTEILHINRRYKLVKSSHNFHK